VFLRFLQNKNGISQVLLHKV